MDWGRVLEVLIVVVLIPLIAWNIKTLIEVRTTLFGADGTNGIRSTVHKLEVESANHDKRIAVLESKEAL